MRYVTRTSALEYEDFNSARCRLIERAEKFGEISCKVVHTYYVVVVLWFLYSSIHIEGIMFHIAGKKDHCYAESRFYL